MVKNHEDESLEEEDNFDEVIDELYEEEYDDIFWPPRAKSLKRYFSFVLYARQ